MYKTQCNTIGRAGRAREPGLDIGPAPHKQKPDEARACIVPKPAGFFGSPSRLDHAPQGLIAKFNSPTSTKSQNLQSPAGSKPNIAKPEADPSPKPKARA